MDFFTSFDTSSFSGNDNKIDLEAVMAAVGIVPEVEHEQKALPNLKGLDLPVASTASPTQSHYVHQKASSSLPPAVYHPAPRGSRSMKRPMMETPAIARATNKRPVYVMSAHNTLNQIMMPQRKPRAPLQNPLPKPALHQPEMFQGNMPPMGLCPSQQQLQDSIVKGNKKGKKNSGDVKKRSNKPSTGYLEMIARALVSAPGHRMVLNDIYSYILQWYPYYQTAPSTWRNAVRHNLTVNDCFVKTGTSSSGRGFLWEVHPACIDMFLKGDFRRMQARRLAQQHYNTENNENVSPTNVIPPNAVTTKTQAPVMMSSISVAASSRLMYPSNYVSAPFQQVNNQKVAVPPSSVYQKNYGSAQGRYQQQLVGFSSDHQTSYTRSSDYQFQQNTSSSSYIKERSIPAPSTCSHLQQSDSFYNAIPDLEFELDQINTDLVCPSSFDYQGLLEDFADVDFEPVAPVYDFVDELLSQS